MKNGIRALAAITGLAMASQTGGADIQTNQVSMSFDAPTAYQDGSPLANSDIVGYRVSFGNTSGQYLLGIAQIPNDATPHVVQIPIATNVLDGDVVNVFTAVQTLVDKNGDGVSLAADKEVSLYSNEQQTIFDIAITGSPPEPPVVNTFILDAVCTGTDAGVTCTATPR